TQAFAVNMLTVVSMFARNLVLLAILSFPAGVLALWPILAMACAAAAIAWRQQRVDVASASLQLGSPLEVRKVAGFGLLFLFIQTVGSLGQRLLGPSGL